MKSQLEKLLESKVAQIILIVGLVVSIQNYFFAPTSKLEARIDDIEKDVETTTKVSAEIQNLKDNHIHTIELAVTEHEKELKELGISMARIETMLDERLPAKK